MEPAFFPDLVDKTGDGFSYEILPVLLYQYIPRRHSPVTLIQSVVRPHCLVTLDDLLRYVESSHGFKSYNRNRDELFDGTEEGNTTPSISEAHVAMNSSDMECDNILPAH